MEKNATMLGFLIVLCSSVGGKSSLPPPPSLKLAGIRGGSSTHSSGQADLNLQFAGKLVPAFNNALSSAKMHGSTLADDLSISFAIKFMVCIYVVLCHNEVFCFEDSGIGLVLLNITDR